MTQIVSSISGIEIYAPSAGNAPTNSADVSAIASAYQVVSATGTQLYAGTAHVTSINGAPISASRAGNAANASLATSAWYDGTGRLISALPDAAEVSAIASAYADDKLDKTAEVVTATAGDGTYVTSINGMEISGQGGGGAQIVTATGSASATAFTGGFPPIATTSYLVSSINGSAILPYGYAALSGNSAKWTSTNSAVSANSAGWTSTNSAVSANSAKWTSTNSAVSANSAKWTSTNSAVSANSANWKSVYNTVSSNSASWSGSNVSSPSGTIVVMNDNEIEGTNSAVVVGQTSMGVTSVVQKNPQLNAIGPTGMTSLTYDNLSDSGMNLVFMLAETYHGDDATVVISGRDHSWYVASASGLIVDGDTRANIPLGTIQSQLSASSDYWINLMYGQDLSGVKAPGYAVTGVRELAWQSAVDNVTNTVAVNSAHWGQGGVDSATVSSIASSYAQSAVSGVESTVSANSASWGAGATGDYVETSATLATIGSNVSAIGTSFVQGDKNTATYFSLVQGLDNSGNNNNTFLQGHKNRGSGSDVFAQGASNSAFGESFAQGSYNKAEQTSVAQGYRCSASSYSFSQGYTNSASLQSFAHGYTNSAYNRSFAQGLGIVVKNTAAAFGTFNLSGDGDTSTGNSAAFAIGDGTAANARHDLMLVTKDGEITMYSSTADTSGTGIMSAIRAISAAATGASVSLPITGSAGAETATYDVTSVSFVRNDTAGEPDIRTASMSPDQLQINYTYNNQAYTSMTLSESTLDFEDADGAHIVDAYSIDTWNSAVDTIANNSATWGQGGVDSATVSAIASSYAESAVSSKADSSALSSYALSADVSGVVSAVTANSASWSQGGVDSATVSAIASSYGDSALAAATSYTDSEVSSRMYASAMQVVTSESLATATGVLYIVVS